MTALKLPYFPEEQREMCFLILGSRPRAAQAIKMAAGVCH